MSFGQKSRIARTVCAQFGDPPSDIKKDTRRSGCLSLLEGGLLYAGFWAIETSFLKEFWSFSAISEIILWFRVILAFFSPAMKRL